MPKKTSKSQYKAVKKHQQGKDRISLLLPSGTKNLIRARYGINVNINQYVSSLINNDLLNIYNNSDINDDTELF